MRRRAIAVLAAALVGASVLAADPAPAAPAAPARVTNPAAPFTLMTIPDTQNYTSAAANRPIMAKQTQWIVSSRSALNTAFVAQLGDIVGIDTNQTQWQAASQYLATLDSAGVPNSVLPGNHDMSMSTGEAPLYRQYFPVSRYATASWNGPTAAYGGYLGQNQFGPDGADRQNLDNYALFTAGGLDFLLLNLEFDPPDYVIDWAKRVLAAYPARRAIVATHAYVDTAGAISSEVLRKDTASRPNSPQQLWQKLISPSCSIFMVINGHFHAGDLSEARRTDTNACGKPVLGLLSDYQERAHGGDGWLRYYTFRPSDNTIQAVTYSPSLDRYETDADSAFTLPYDMTLPGPDPGSDPGPGPAPGPGPGPGTALAQDAFGRTAGNGWGTAETGGAWTVSGTASRYAVSGGQGVQTVPTAVTTISKLAGVSSSTTDLSVTLSLAAIPNGPTYIAVGGRVVGSADLSARVKVNADGSVDLHVSRSGTVLAGGKLAGVTLTGGAPLRVRVQVQGTSPTTVRARAWPAAAPEPSTWAATATDATPALQAPGAVQLSTYLSSSATNGPLTIRYDDLVATPIP